MEEKSKELSTTNNNLPKFADLVKDVGNFQEQDKLNYLLNNDPPAKWVKNHPYVSNHRYLPIDKVEYFLRKIFKRYRIEVTGQGTSFNGVYVTVRVHFLNPIINDWDFHDGIGAIHLQVKSGSSPSQLENINNGALSMAYPLAKTLAIKDACDHFGNLFGANLNRKDTLPNSMDSNLQEKENPVKNRILMFIEGIKTPSDIIQAEKIIKEEKLSDDKQIKEKLNEKESQINL